MSLNILYLFISFLGFIIIYLIAIQYKINKNTNAFLIYFILLSSLRFLTYGIPNIFFKDCSYYFETLFTLNAWPTLYLYFRKLIHTDKIKPRELGHYIIPFALFILFCIKGSISSLEVLTVITKICFVGVLIMNLFYAISSYKLLNNNVWNRSSDILSITQQNKIMDKWTKLLFVLFCLMMVRVIVNLLINNQNNWYVNKNNFFWVGSILWIILYVRIISSPEFLYGYEMFQNKIKEYKKNNIIFNNIWEKKANKEVNNIQDRILKEKIDSLIESYIIDVEHIALNTDAFYLINFSIEDLALKLKLPKSHLGYLFKYHASISFTEFKKIIRIQKSIRLIGAGFLKNNTMESLANKVGFSSYSSFFKSFKTIIGESPQEYFQKNK